MQTLVQAFCRGRIGSLRKKISNDKQLEDYKLTVIKHKSKNRRRGWLKLKAVGANGALNIEWNARTKILWTRIVNKGDGRPGEIAGYFVTYLLAKHWRIVKSIHLTTIE